jgi:hypothetical protein
MKYFLFTIIFLAALIGCSHDGAVTGPSSEPTSSTSGVKNNILYTFSVSKDILGISDTLSMELTALNQSSTVDTLYSGSNSFTWSLTNSSGEVILSGPKIFNNLIIRVIITPHQSAVLIMLEYSMAGIFGETIQTGFYHLQCNINNGLSLELNLLCVGS